jgi:hypothetical protein
MCRRAGREWPRRHRPHRRQPAADDVDMLAQVTELIGEAEGNRKPVDGRLDALADRS